MSSLDNLEAYRVAMDLAESAYRLTQTEPLSRHFRKIDQIRRSAVSIPANIAEGYGLGTRKQRVRCLRISLGSAYELRTHLQLAGRLGLIAKTELSGILAIGDQAIRLIVGLLKSLDAQT